MQLERLQASERDWNRLDTFDDRIVFQTREWIEFLASAVGAEPVLASVADGSDVVGYFTGLRIRRYGVPILGSPFRGWSTPYMGFNLADGVSRRDAVDALARFAFDELRCLHLELQDRELSVEDVEGLPIESVPGSILEVDLRPSEEEIFARMTSATRRCVRKAEKVGVRLEKVDDLGFADDYYAQLRQVFARQRLVPPFGLERVRELIRHLGPTGRLLLVRALSPEGECIATGIYPAMNKTMHFWGGASWRETQILRPNEAIMWYAMRYWKARGIEACDLGGTFPPYKFKYGPVEHPLAFVRASRYRALSTMRGLASRGHFARRRVLGRIAAFRPPARIPARRSLLPGSGGETEAGRIASQDT